MNLLRFSSTPITEYILPKKKTKKKCKKECKNAWNDSSNSTNFCAIDYCRNNASNDQARNAIENIDSFCYV